MIPQRNTEKPILIQQILIQVKKKEKYEDLIVRTLEEEIAALIETGMLHSNDNSIFTSNPLNTPTK